MIIILYKNDVNKDNLFQNLSYEYMIYLRDRALTRAKINDSILNKEKEKKINFAKNILEEEEIIYNNNQIFIKIVHQINELLKLLDKLISKGFYFYIKDKINKIKNDNEEIKSEDIISNINNLNDPLLLKIRIIIENDNEENRMNFSYKIKYFLNGEEIKSFNELYAMIQNIYNNIINIQKNGYFKKNYIKYIYGKQFQLFFDYFYNGRKSDNLYYFLCYFLNKEKIEIPNIDYINKKNKKPKLNLKEDLNTFYQDFIEHSERFLDDALKYNKLKLELILEKNKIKKNFIKYKGIYLNGCSNLEKRYNRLV